MEDAMGTAGESGDDHDGERRAALSEPTSAATSVILPADREEWLRNHGPRSEEWSDSGIRTAIGAGFA